MAEGVYVLCAITGAACAMLLLNGYRRCRARVLLWAGICFFGLAAHNVLLFVDLVVLPDVDLFCVRTPLALLALSVLLYGLIWESR